MSKVQNIFNELLTFFLIRFDKNFERLHTDSNVEMSWFTFAGEYSDLYDALMKAWCIKMNLPIDDETLAKYFKLHLERGIAHLSGTNYIKNLDDLMNLAIKEK